MITTVIYRVVTDVLSTGVWRNFTASLVLFLQFIFWTF